MQIITDKQVKDNIQNKDLVNKLELSFKSYYDGLTTMPAKSYLNVPKGDFRSMPAYVNTDSINASGVKWVNVHPNNSEESLPTVMGTIIYTDPETGEPLATIEATELTALRTGAVASLATRTVCEEVDTYGIIGLGKQAYLQLSFIQEFYDFEDIIIYDIDDKKEKEFVANNSEFNVRRGNLEDFLDCDVISTTTPTRDSYLKEEHVSDDVHINAMGADAEGKKELYDNLVLDSKVIVDDIEQASHSGEINTLVSENKMDTEDIFCSLGELLVENYDTDGKTIFDSTGLAIQDITAAYIVYNSIN